MWLENVEVLVKSSSSADEHRASKVGKSVTEREVPGLALYAWMATYDFHSVMFSLTVILITRLNYCN